MDTRLSFLNIPASDGHLVVSDEHSTHLLMVFAFNGVQMYVETARNYMYGHQLP